MLQLGLFRELHCRPVVDDVHEGASQQDAGREGAVDTVDAGRDREDEHEK